MLKKTIIPLIIGFVAAVLFVVSLVVVPGIVILVATIPVIGTVLNFLISFTFWGTSVVDFFYAFVSAVIALGFINLCTRYDNEYPYLEAARKAAITAGALVVLVFIATFAFVVSSNGFTLDLLVSLFPYAIMIGMLLGYQQ